MKKIRNGITADKKLNEAVSALTLNNIENYVSEIIKRPDFNWNTNQKEISFIKNAEFISIEKEESFISEEEFFNIIDAKNQRLTSKSKRYQRSLYSHYMRAKREKDNGYRNDVLKKAEILRNNIETVLYLMQNEDFMTEWKNQVGEISPLEDLKENGRMRRINIVRSYIE